MNYNSLLKFLYFEGYADSYEEAEYLLEELSDEEFDELCEKHVKEMNPRGKDHRASQLGRVRKRRKPTPDKYKYSEGDFSARDLSSGARQRRDIRSSTRGGTNVTESTAPRPTRLPKSREQSHDDWKDNVPTEWEQRSPKTKRLATRLTQVVGTQRRQDKEVGLREENKRDEYLRTRGEKSKDAAMRKSRERRADFSSGTTHSDARRENITWARPGTRSYDDSLNRQRKEAHRRERGRKKAQPGTSSEQRRLDAVWQSRFPEDRPKGRMEKLTPQQVKQQKQGVLTQGERRRELRGQAIRALRRVGFNVTEALVEYLIANNITDCSQSALHLLESMSDAWFYEILESSGMSKEDRETWDRLTKQHGPNPFTSQNQSKPEPAKSAKRKFTTNLKSVKITEDYQDLTPEQEERVKNRVGELVRDIQVHAAKKEIKPARRKQKLVQNASDALIRTSTSRSAAIQKRINDLRQS